MLQLRPNCECCERPAAKLYPASTDRVAGPGSAQETALREAFATRDMKAVSSLRFGNEARERVAWFAGDDWWLSASRECS